VRVVGQERVPQALAAEMAGHLLAGIESAPLAARWRRCLVRDLEVEWSSRLVRALASAATWPGGPKNPHYRADSRPAVIRLSVHLLPLADAAERRELALHELAHIVADWRYGRGHEHDARWFDTLRTMGGEGGVYYEGPVLIPEGWVALRCGCRRPRAYPPGMARAVARTTCRHCRKARRVDR